MCVLIFSTVYFWRMFQLKTSSESYKICVMFPESVVLCDFIYS
jgi:hypothetical protein